MTGADGKAGSVARGVPAGVVYRVATEADLPAILGFIRDLARYEKAEDRVVATEQTLRHWMFGRRVAEAMLATCDGVPIGFALYFYNFSTWLGRAGLYLEDVYVAPGHRGRGVGRGFFVQLARKATEEGCGRLDWWCLRWNEPSLGFYQALGAVRMEEWISLRLEGEAIRALAEG